MRNRRKGDNQTNKVEMFESAMPRYSTVAVSHGGPLDSLPGLYQVTVSMPRFCPVREVTGAAEPSKPRAKERAVLKMVEALFKVGAIDHTLRATMVTEIEVCYIL
jgi:hypothetical protein